MLEVLQCLAFGIGQSAVLQHAITAAHSYDTARDSNHSGVVGNGVNHHRPGANAHVIADPDIAKNTGPGAHHDAVAQSGMAFAGLIARAAKCDPLEEQYVIADLGGLADHYAHSV